MVIFILALGVTAVGSGVPSYWNDEAATLRLARLPLADILGFVQEKDAVHAVYAALMHVWIQAVGESEFAVRFPSAVAIASAAVGLFVLLRDFERPRAALLASFVFVILPRSSFNGVEARSSALVTALVVWAAVCAVRAAKENRVWLWVALAVLVGASIAVFLYAVLVLPAICVLALSIRPRPTLFVRFLTTGIAGVLLASPVWLTAAGQSAQVGWLESQQINIYTIVVEPFFGSSWWLAALVIVVLATGALTKAFRGEATIVIAAITWIVIPLAVLLTATWFVSPMFTPRYMSVSSPAIAILMALAVASWRRRVVTGVVSVFVIAALPWFIAVRMPLGKPAGQDLRGLAQFFVAQSQPDDAVILGDSGTVSLRPRIALAAYPEAFVKLDDIAFLATFADTGTYSDRLLDSDALESRLQHARRVWVVSPAGGESSPTDAQLGSAGLTRRSIHHVPTMTIVLWTR